MSVKRFPAGSWLCDVQKGSSAFPLGMPFFMLRPFGEYDEGPSAVKNDIFWLNQLFNRQRQCELTSSADF